MRSDAEGKWQTINLGDVIDIVMGQAPAGKDCNKTGLGTPFVKTGEFGPLRPVIREWTTDPKKLGRETDVFISVVGATCGKINLGADCAIGRSVAALRPNPERLDQFFLHYFLEGQVERLRKGSLGAAQTVISKEMLAQTRIPLPPIEEQRRIVAVLDEVVEGLARARVLAEANLKSARDLFDEAVAKVFDDVRQKTSKLCRLGEVSAFRNGLNYTQSSQGQRVRIVGVGNFKDNFELPLDELSEVTIEGALSEDDHLQAGDILAVRSNGNRELIGRTMLVPELTEPVSFSGFTIRIRLTTHDLLPDFLCELLKTRDIRLALTGSGGGANISNLNQQTLWRLNVFVPSKEDQTASINRLQRVREASENLHNYYEARVRDIDHLRQSLLHKAFSGELT